MKIVTIFLIIFIIILIFMLLTQISNILLTCYTFTILSKC